MNINTHQNYTRPNFQAVKVAETRTAIGKIKTNIDIYKLGSEDKNFLQKLAIKTDIVELCSNIREDLAERWQEIFDYCITRAFDRDNTTYIAMHKDKPCGIITYYPKSANGIFLDGICALPINRGKKVPYTGQSLFMQLFKDAEAQKIKSIELDAVQDGPFNVESKYESLGFKKDPTTTPYTKMTCGKYKIKEQLEELPSTIDYKKINSTRNINLEYTLD